MFNLFVGSYTFPIRHHTSPRSGIASGSFDPATGQLVLKNPIISTQNPSWLCLHPSVPVLYAIEELQESSLGPGGAIVVFQRQNTLVEMQRISTGFPGPCQALVNQNHLWVAHYSAGTTSCFPIMPNGTLGDPLHWPHGQLVPGFNHAAHQCLSIPQAEGVLSIDIAADMVFFWNKLNPVPEATIRLPKGWGPRHGVFHPTLPRMYLLCEYVPIVIVLDSSPHSASKPRPWPILQTLAILPQTHSGPGHGAAIKISDNGQDIYVSCRENANSISHCLVNQHTGLIELGSVIDCGGVCPRDLSISPDQKWLAVANQESDCISVISRNPNGCLGQPYTHTPWPCPSCIVFASA
jgi:6-phosphogluconolactonase